MTTNNISPNQTDETTPFKRLKSPLAYLGGKSKLAKIIVERLPKHTCYVEPFVGGGWVYFTKRPSKNEILNDADSQLVTFWRVVKSHLPEFLRHLEFGVVSREEFRRKNKQDPSLLMTDIQRAVRYYEIQKAGYGGKTTGRTFGTSSVRPNSLNYEKVEEKLRETHKRMIRTTIENLDACECIRRYDAEYTLFYIDPPYWAADFYAISFKENDFIQLRNTLKDIKGKFILSLNDTPEVREIFKDFIIESISTKYSLGNSKVSQTTRNVERKEVLIYNFERNVNE